MNKKYWIFLLLTILSFIAANDVFTQPLQDTMFIDTPGEYPIYKHLLIFQTNQKLTPQYVVNSVPPASFVRLFPKKSFDNESSIALYYWLLVSVKNELKTTQTFYYKLNNCGLSIVNAYTKGDNDIFSSAGRSGYYIPIDQRQNKSHDAEFHLLLNSNETKQILLEIEDPSGINSFFLPQFMDRITYLNNLENYYLIIGLITGIMILTSLLNFFFAISLNEKIHYLYGIYVLAVLYEILMLEGTIENYIIPGDYRLAEIFVLAWPNVCFYLMIIIMQWFLQQKKENSYFKIPLAVIKYVLISFCLVIVCSYFIPYSPGLHSFIQTADCLTITLAILLIMASAIEKIIQKYKLAWLYLFATTWLFIGFFEYILIFLGANEVSLTQLRHPNDLEMGLMAEAVIVFIAIIYRYNLYKKEKEKLLIEVNKQQETLLTSIVAAEEEERKRIATDLHDDVGATLSALNLHITSSPNHFRDSNTGEEFYNKSIFLSSKAANDIRNIAHNLLPKDFQKSGLFSILRQRINELNLINSIFFELVTEGNEKKIPENLSIIVYRIATELISNIIKHSKATEGTIQLLVEEKAVQIMIEDDGIGFNSDLEYEGIGLKNIKRRVSYLQGNIYIDSNAEGTHLIIDIPLRNGD